MNLAELTGLEKHAAPAGPADWLQQLKNIGGQAQQGIGSVVQGVKDRDPNSMGIAGAAGGALLGGLGGGEHWLRNAILGGLVGGGAGLYGNDIYNAYDRNRPLNAHGNQPRPRGFQHYQLPEPQKLPQTHNFRNGFGMMGGGFGTLGGAFAGANMGKGWHPRFGGIGHSRMGALTGLLGGGLLGGLGGNALDRRVYENGPQFKTANAASQLPKPSNAALTTLLGAVLGGGAGAGIGAVTAGKGKRMKGALTGGAAGAATGALGGAASGLHADHERRQGQEDGLHLALEYLQKSMGR